MNCSTTKLTEALASIIEKTVGNGHTVGMVLSKDDATYLPMVETAFRISIVTLISTHTQSAYSSNCPNSAHYSMHNKSICNCPSSPVEQAGESVNR